MSIAKKTSVGRPKQMKDGKAVRLYLDSASIKKAKEIGKNNASEGVRIALLKFIPVILIAILMAGCGGGSGGNSSAPTQQSIPAAPILASNVRSVVFEGDSLSALGSTTTWPTTVMNDSHWTNTNWVDDAIGGTTTVQMLARYDANVHPLRPGIAGNGVMLIFGGTNDLRYGLGNAASTYADLVQHWAQDRADGFKVIAFTLHSVRNPAPSLNFQVVESERITLNQLIRSNPGLYDGLVEMDNIFTNLDDATLLYDQVHFTPAGNALVVTAVETVLARM